MAVTIKHPFVSAVADGADATLVRPTNWNANLTLTMATGNILGRTTAGEGAVEEIPYVEGSFTPTFTFGTPGDLSVVYTTQLGRYTRIGNRVFFDLSLVFTPTHTTASGVALIGGLPIAALNLVDFIQSVSIGQMQNVDWGATDGQINARIGWNSTDIILYRAVDAGVGGSANTPHFPTGVAFTLAIGGSYQV